MNKRQKLRQRAIAEKVETKAAATAAKERSYAPLVLGTFSVPTFDGPAVVFGASEKDYPRYEDIPRDFRSFNGRYPEIVGQLFYSGGRLEDHGIRLKSTVDRRKAFAAIQAWLSSFAPKHELKVATVAWALSEWTEDI